MTINKATKAANVADAVQAAAVTVPATDPGTFLRDFARGTAKALQAGESARVLLVKAAITAANVDAFDKAAEAMYHDIRKNVRGLAKAVNAAPTKNGKAYSIPGAIRTPVSQIRDALARGVSLGTVDKPRGFGDIREDARKAREASEKGASEAEARKADPLHDMRTRVLSALDDAAAFVRDCTDKATLEAFAKALLPAAAIVTKATADEAEANAPAVKAAA